jgi:hypothetical protein
MMWRGISLLSVACLLASCIGVDARVTELERQLRERDIEIASCANNSVASRPVLALPDSPCGCFAQMMERTGAPESGECLGFYVMRLADDHRHHPPTVKPCERGRKEKV